MKRSTALWAAFFMIIACGQLHAADPGWARPNADVFDTLHDNVWYLRTSDKAASLYVTEIGKGPTVVVLHGGAGGDFNYLVDPIRPFIGRNHFVLFDQRGSALSPVADDKTSQITMNILVDDLEQLRVALGEPKMWLFGHSFGTLLALNYYKKYPEHVAGLILSGTFPPDTPIDGNLDSLVKQMRVRSKALMARPRVARLLEKEGVSGDPKKLSPKQLSIRNRIVAFADFDLVHVERWRQLQGGGVFYNAAVDNAVGASLPDTYDFRSVMKDHPVPISVIQGDQDYVDPSASAWAGTTARVQVVAQASHYAWIDKPAAFTAALGRALQASREDSVTRESEP